MPNDRDEMMQVYPEQQRLIRHSLNFRVYNPVGERDA